MPTFDRYLYAGAVASLRYSDPITLHNIAIAETNAQPSPFPMESVKNEPYFEDVLENPYHFAEQMGLLRIKLGYIATGYMLWRAGLPIISGLRLISALSFSIVSVVLLAWARDVLLASLLLLTPPLLNLGRMVTADPLSTSVIFSALFALANRKPLLAAFLLLISILIRADNIVLVLFLLVWMFFRHNLAPRTLALFALTAAMITVVVNKVAGLYGWRVLTQHGLIKPEVTPITHPILISFSGYLSALAGLRSIPYTFMGIWLFIGAAVWKMTPANSFFRSLLKATGCYLIIRMFLYPYADDRFYVWAYLVTGTALIHITRSFMPEHV